jgi:transcriptional regulator with XRE-family HTH domain
MGGANFVGALCVLNDDDVLRLLRAAVEREGSQAAFAKRYGLDRAHVNSALNGRRRVSASLVKALGLRKVYVIDDQDVLSRQRVDDIAPSFAISISAARS